MIILCLLYLTTAFLNFSFAISIACSANYSKIFSFLLIFNAFVYFFLIILMGMPIRSASLNLTPGLSSLSSSITSTPFAIAQNIFFCQLHLNTVSGINRYNDYMVGAIAIGHIIPFSSLFCSIAAMLLFIDSSIP